MPFAPADLCSQGVEEKEGKGTCACDKGYAGDMCQECDAKYYQEDPDDDDDEDDDDEGEGELQCKGQLQGKFPNVII